MSENHSEVPTLGERITAVYDALHPCNSGGARAWFLREYRKRSGHDVPDSTYFDWIKRGRVNNRHWPAFNAVLRDLVMEATDLHHGIILSLDDVL